jgi:hypothetical protein
MTYRLFIDDERFPVDDDWVIVRSSSEAIDMVISKGIPSRISFDHDLGGDDTSIVFINWLIDHLLDNNLKLPYVFSFYVHSQNPIGKENIISKMTQIEEHFK